MRRIVRDRAMGAALLPVALLSLATTLLFLQFGAARARAESRQRAEGAAMAIDIATSLLDEKLRVTLGGSGSIGDSAFAWTLSRMVDADSSVCLASVWKGDSLLFSHPRRDVAPVVPMEERSWTGVAIDPRCDEPVVRHGIRMEGGAVAEFAFRLSSLSSRLLDPIRRQDLRIAVIDDRGVFVAGARPAILRQSEVDPVVAELPDARSRASGVRLEDGRAVAWCALPLRGPPWMLVAREDGFDVLEHVASLLLLMVLAFGVAVALAVRLSRHVVERAIRPLEALRKSIESVEAGKQEYAIPASGLSEIDGLSEAFTRVAVAVEEREGERRAELERMVAELESFSSSVSHDLRAPLRSIDGFAAALEEDEGEKLDEEGLRMLGRIRGSAKRMGDLIEDLLRLSRTTRAPLQKRRVDMDALVAEVLEALEPHLEGRAIQWHVGVLGRAWGDPGLLRQVWENLLSNAAKYTGDVTDPVVDVSRRAESGMDAWVVRDNGAGFDSAAAAALFKPFQRLHDARRFPGTGVGLALARRIVEKHGGSIAASGTQGVGAEFVFRLPVHRAGSGEERAPS